MVMRQHKGCFNPYSTSQTHFSYFVTCHLPGFGMLYKNVTLGRLGRRVLLDLQRIEMYMIRAISVVNVKVGHA